VQNRWVTPGCGAAEGAFGGWRRSHSNNPPILLISRQIDMARRFSGGTKQDRVRDYVLLHAAPRFTIAEIRRALPGVSDNTIRPVLGEEKQSGSITHDGSGRGAA
jgi:hypothetical protein